MRVLAYLIDGVCIKVFSLGLKKSDDLNLPPSLPLDTLSVSIRKTDEAVLAVPVFLYSTCFQRQEEMMEALNTIAVKFSSGHL